jgi:hypothetical protein
LISALPLLWNQFSFVEAGLPFSYMKISKLETADVSSFGVSFILRYLLYDLVIVAVFVWILTYFRKTIKKQQLK